MLILNKDNFFEIISHHRDRERREEEAEFIPVSKKAGWMTSFHSLQMAMKSRQGEQPARAVKTLYI